MVVPRLTPFAAVDIGVQTNTPSNSAAFNNLAIAFAKNLKWQPAAKNGTPVEGWTQFAFYPSER